MHIRYNQEFEHRLKAGFIGCGSHAFRNVAPCFQFAPVQLVAACDLQLKQAQSFRIFGAERFYTDHRAMLETEKLDVVFIVTNYDEQGHPRYPAIAQDALAAGAHVWIEKPPAASSEEILALINASQTAHRHVGVGFKKMFFPANQKAKEIISRPQFGRVSSITARYPQSLPPLEARSDDRKMIGFLDHVVHPHSLLRLLGGDLEWLFANRHENGAAMVSLRFKNGIVGNLHFANGQAGHSHFEHTEVVGEGENVVIENNLRVRYFRKGSGPAYGREGTYFGADESAPLCWEPEFSLGQLHNKGLFLLGYAPEIIHFTTHLLENKGPELGTLQDALEILKIYEAYRKPDGVVQYIN
ncbi:MAG TPA: Gfo/Idh/MocA family oxidoreductase [Abditibacteriaceae bacterium]|jgi:predicted dehydrogenase